MMASSKRESSLSFLWKLTAPIFPFIIFLILGVFQFDLQSKAFVAAIGIIIWFFVLLIGFFRDYEKNKVERIHTLTQSDAIVTLWKATIDIKADGSAVITRQIHGVNLAPTRKYFEFESQADLPMPPNYVEMTKQSRLMNVSVKLSRKDGSTQQVLTNHSFEPKNVRMVDALIHMIPLANTSTNVAPLESQEEFDIEIKEQTKADTFSLDGDWYSHRVRHMTEELHITIMLPQNYRCSHRIPVGESRVLGQVKSPTLGEWENTRIQPKIETNGNREIIEWHLRPSRTILSGSLTPIIQDPRLLHEYKLTYCRLEHSG
jgi:hypothetical protein